MASISGAVAALGDTLYPSASLAEGLRADLSAASHLLIRLRMLHPVLAVSAVAIAMLIAPRLARDDDATGQRLARVVVAVSGLQVLAGLTNVLLLAPIWMQLVHLLLANAVWISLVLLGARAIGGARRRQPDAGGVGRAARCARRGARPSAARAARSRSPAARIPTAVGLDFSRADARDRQLGSESSRLSLGVSPSAPVPEPAGSSPSR